VPSYLAVDSSGNVYFADPNNDEVDEISAPVISGGVVTGGDILNLLAGDGSDTAPTTGQSGKVSPLAFRSVLLSTRRATCTSRRNYDEVDELSLGPTPTACERCDVLNILAAMVTRMHRRRRSWLRSSSGRAAQRGR